MWFKKTRAKIWESLYKLVAVKSNVDSKKFLAIFIYTPIVIKLMLTNPPNLGLISMVLGFIGLLLGLRSIDKYNQNNVLNNNSNGDTGDNGDEHSDGGDGKNEDNKNEDNTAEIRTEKNKIEEK